MQYRFSLTLLHSPLYTNMRKSNDLNIVLRVIFKVICERGFWTDT